MHIFYYISFIISSQCDMKYINAIYENTILTIITKDIVET